MKRKQFLIFFVYVASMIQGAVLAQPFQLTRKAADYQRSEFAWASDDQKKKEGLSIGKLYGAVGWGEYDFEVPRTGWYELWLMTTAGWNHEISLDGQQLHYGPFAEQVVKNSEYKLQNVWLTTGQKHTLKVQGLTFPGLWMSGFAFRESKGDAAASGMARLLSSNILRLGEQLRFTVTAGGNQQAVVYSLQMRRLGTDEAVSQAEMSFTATSSPVTKRINMSCPQEGIFEVRASSEGKLLGVGDLRIGQVIVIDTRHSPAPAPELKKSLVVDIDCTQEKTTDFWEKDGKSAVISTPFGKYRESSGKGMESIWATDGFSYQCDLPESNVAYLLEVDYPDDDRRTMGFWVNDQIKLHGDLGAVMTGGVETGDYYRLTHQMQTHQAIFYPRNNKKVIIAIVNLNHGMKAAASRIRVFKIDSPLTAGPPNNKGGRSMGYYFEEPSRWLRQFGANSMDIAQHLLTLERWAQMCRYTGANLLFPTINVYQGNAYPSKILEGYFNSAVDQPRLTSLIAEKYGLSYVPEMHVSGNGWFDEHTMKKGKPEGDEWTVRDKDGKPGVYNALHPKVQATYISIFGELADRLIDCPAFKGISSRMMLGWQWQGWNCLPGLNWGYDDWTLSQFEKDTGIRVPGEQANPKRFMRRFEFLTGPKLKEWQTWRCKKILSYHRRLRDRIRKAKPDALLYFSYFGPAPGDALGRTETEKLRELGMDPEAYAKEAGIVVIPSVAYGRRISTPLMDASLIEGMCDPIFKSLGMLGNRGFGLYGSYFEVCDSMNWKPLGAEKSGIAFDVCTPTARNELELFASQLADCDCSTLTLGANGNIFGNPLYLREFLAEYKALPALPFTPLAQGRDPVAVWYLKPSAISYQPSADQDFYFYAVNRERYPVTVTLTLSEVRQLVSAASGKEIRLIGNQLILHLAAYQLRTFRASGKSIITTCKVQVPSEEKSLLAEQLNFVENIATSLRDRTLAFELPQEETQAFINLATESRHTFNEGCFWRARVNLERAAMVRIYDLIGAWPPKLQDRKDPHGFPTTTESRVPKLEFFGEKKIIGDIRGALSSVRDLSHDSQNNLWVASPEQVMVFDEMGKYQRSLRLTLPAKPDSGDARWSGLVPPLYQNLEALRILPTGVVLSMGINSPMLIHEPNAGRVLSLATGNSFSLAGTEHRQVAIDVKGFIYVAIEQPADAVGVWKYKTDGIAAFDFGTTTKSNRLNNLPMDGIAVDGKGRIYGSDRQGKRLLIYDAEGALRETLDFKDDDGPRRLTVTHDGNWLFVATGAAGVVAFQRTETGAFTQRWKQPCGAQVTSLSISPKNELVLGFATPVEQSVVRNYLFDEKGITLQKNLIPCLNAEQLKLPVRGTRLKAFGGSLYYLRNQQLIRLLPGDPDRVEVVFDPGPFPEIVSFTIAPNGDLYLGSNGWPWKRDVTIYRCTKTAVGWDKPQSITGDKPFHTAGTSIIPYDLVVDTQGNLLSHWDAKEDWPELRIFSRHADSEMKELINMGGWWVGGLGTWEGQYGLHVAGDGRLYVAGGRTRSIACLSPEGALQWKVGHEVHQGPGSLPIRGPFAITTDSRGYVWVADTDGNRLLCFDTDGKFLSSCGHFGTIDARDGESFCGPTGIATVKDSQGVEWLYVVDAGNQRFLKYRIK